MNLSEIKSELQRLGISANTPGLLGDERFEELKIRLEQATGKSIGKEQAQSDQSSQTNKTTSQIDEFKSLSIGELRNRLTTLGVSTQTPGLSGEDRWNALIQRLIDTICGGSGVEPSKASPPKSIETTKSKNRLPPDLPPPEKLIPEEPVAIPDAKEIVEEQPIESTDAPTLGDITYTRINELKKRMKTIANKRSMYIASKFSAGETQDATLKRSSLQLAYAEEDISMCTGAVAKGENKIFGDALKSIAVLNEILKITPAKDMMISIQKVLPMLETHRNELKEEIRLRRLLIRDEADHHPEYGLHIEAGLQEELNKETFQNTKISRTRQKLNFMKSIDETFLSTTDTTATTATPSSSSDTVIAEAKKDYFLGAIEKKSGRLSSSQSSSALLTSSAVDEKTVNAAETNALQTKLNIQDIYELLSEPCRRQIKRILQDWGSKTAAVDRLSQLFDSQKGKLSSEKKLSMLELIMKAEANDRFTRANEISRLYQETTSFNSVLSRSKAAEEALGWLDLQKNLTGEDIWLLKKILLDIERINHFEKDQDIQVLTMKAREMFSPSAIAQYEEECLVKAQQQRQKRNETKENIVEEQYLNLSSKSNKSNKSSEVKQQEDQQMKKQVLPAEAKPVNVNGSLKPDHKASSANNHNPDKSKVFLQQKSSETKDNEDREEEDDDEEDEEEDEDSEDDDDEGAEAQYKQTKDNLLNKNNGNERQLQFNEEEQEEDDDEDHKEAMALLSKASSATVMVTGHDDDIEEIMMHYNQLSRASTSHTTSTNVSLDQMEAEEDDDDSEPEEVIQPQVTKYGKPKPPLVRPPPPTQAPPKSSLQLPYAEEEEDHLHDNLFTDPVDIVQHQLQQQRDVRALSRQQPVASVIADDVDADGGPSALQMQQLVVINSTTSEDDEEDDDTIQLITLYEHAKVLEQLNDIPAAEVMYERALEMDPLNITSLQAMAVFLTQKKGELTRAEAFFHRALQLCLPSIFHQIRSPQKEKKPVDMMEKEESSSSRSHSGDIDKAMRKGSFLNVPIMSLPLHELQVMTPKNNNITPSKLQTIASSSSLGFTDERYSIRQIVSLLLSFAKFMSKSRGDIEVSFILLTKAVKLSPDNAFVLATYAHFLSQNSTHLSDATNKKQIEEYYQAAMKYEPKIAIYIMWYGHFLKKIKQYSRADFLYKLALTIAQEGTQATNKTTSTTAVAKQVATCMCNYATFLFKQRKHFTKAESLFLEGLGLYPNHKGLRKNYKHLVKYKEKHPEKFTIVVVDGEVESKGESSGIKKETLEESVSSSSSGAEVAEVSSPPPSSANRTPQLPPSSRRAQRAQHSLASTIPEEFQDNSELKSQYIVQQLQKELTLQLENAADDFK